MPLGIVSDEQFNEALNDTSSQVKKEVPMPIIKESRIGQRGPSIPDSLRVIVGEEVVNGTTPAEIKQTFGIGAPAVSAFHRGFTSSINATEGNQTNKKLANHINNVRDRISRKAGKRLFEALDSLNNLDGVKARDKAGIAKDMSVIIKNMQPEQSTNINNGVQFVIHRPNMREEKDFEVIEVNE